MKKMRPGSLYCVLLAVVLACQQHPGTPQATLETAVLERTRLQIRAGAPVAGLEGERYFRNVRQLTFGGENTRAYWSGDGTKLVFQSRRPPFECDQIFVIDLETGEETLASTGKGRATCAFFLQGDRRILYSSTHLAAAACPPAVPDYCGRVARVIDDGCDIFDALPDGSDPRRLTASPGYDSEGSVDPVTGRIVFTSMRDGDLELYSMEPDGSDVRRLTGRIGYDGGAFYSHDGTKIVLCSGYCGSPAAEADHQTPPQQGLVVPRDIQIAVMDRDGGYFHWVTDNGRTNFAPFFHPDNERILFSSNQDAPDRRDFEIYMIDESGENQVRITRNPTFDGFPMFSPGGDYLAFSSNRYGEKPGETNIFVCEWVEAER